MTEARYLLIIYTVYKQLVRLFGTISMSKLVIWGLKNVVSCLFNRFITKEVTKQTSETSSLIINIPKSFHRARKCHIHIKIYDYKLYNSTRYTRMILKSVCIV